MRWTWLVTKFDGSFWMDVPLMLVSELSSTASASVPLMLMAPAGRLKTRRTRSSSLALLKAEVA